MIVVFKSRLIFLNTIENDNSGGLGVNTQYVNRARYSAAESPMFKMPGMNLVNLMTKELIILIGLVETKLMLQLMKLLLPLNSLRTD